MGGSERWRGGLQHPEWLVGGGEVHDGSVVITGYSMDMFPLPLGRDCRSSMEWTFFFDSFGLNLMRSQCL